VHGELLCRLADLSQSSLQARVIGPLPTDCWRTEAALLYLRAIKSWDSSHYLPPANEPNALPTPPRIDPLAALLALL